MAPTPPVLDAPTLSRAYQVAGEALKLLRDPQQGGAQLFQYIQAMTLLGLGGHARQQLELMETPDATAKRLLENLRAYLSQVPSGQILWSARQRRALKNIEVLQQVDPASAEISRVALEAFKSQENRYQLYCSVDRNYHILDTQSPYLSQWWLGGFADHRLEAQLQRPPADETLAPAVFDGVAYGWILMDLLERPSLAWIDYQQALYVLEPDLHAWALFLHLHDLREHLASRRLRLFLGQDCLERYSQRLRQEKNWTLPSIYIDNRLSFREATSIRSLNQELSRERKAQETQLFEKIAATWAHRDAAFWSRRYDAAIAGEQPPLRIMGVASRYTSVLQRSLRELGQAIEASGHQFHLLTEPDSLSHETPLLETIESYQPDLIIQLSRLRHEWPDMPRHIPFLCWDQDLLPALTTPEAGASLDSLTFIAGWAAFHGWINKRWPTPNCLLTLPVGSSRVPEMPENPTLPPECQISYLSHASATWQTLLKQQVEKWSEKNSDGRLSAQDYHASAQGLMAELESHPMADGIQIILRWAREVSRRAGGSASGPLEATLLFQSQRLRDRWLRHRVLSWAAEFARREEVTFRIFGDGWQDHPELAPFAGGYLKPGWATWQLYQRCPINLQIIQQSIIHSRLLDGVLGGGFFLNFVDSQTRYQPEPLVYQAARWLIATDLDFTQDMPIWKSQALRQAWNSYSVGCSEPQVDSFVGLGWPPHLESFRSFLALGYLPSDATLLPETQELGFSSPGELHEKLAMFLHHPEQRHRVRESLRGRAQRYFSYEHRWGELLQGVRAGLDSYAHRIPPLRYPCPVPPDIEDLAALHRRFHATPS